MAESVEPTDDASEIEDLNEMRGRLHSKLPAKSGDCWNIAPEYGKVMTCFARTGRDAGTPSGAHSVT